MKHFKIFSPSSIFAKTILEINEKTRKTITTTLSWGEVIRTTLKDKDCVLVNLSGEGNKLMFQHRRLSSGDIRHVRKKKTTKRGASIDHSIQDD